ncbi:MAG: HAMP domain-containing sensor histidine kinase, partial [Pontixanthobacter sp.]
ARARIDADGCLQEAQEPLITLQRRCGGTFPGPIAIPELREIVQRALDTGIKQARTIRAFDGEEEVSAWIDAVPAQGAGSGCIVGVANWQTHPLPDATEIDELRRRQMIDQIACELSARLDMRQNILTVESDARDLADVTARMRHSRGTPWTDFVTLGDGTRLQPVHWRLLDGADCRIEGSDRNWRVSLIPLGQPMPGSQGFDLMLIADHPLAVDRSVDPNAIQSTMHSIGRDLSPVLRQPIARIIANAETIRSKMAGPLSDEYSDYAGDIAEAGQHLMSLIEDLADLEIVESDNFSTAPDQIDAIDVARRAAGILAVRAKEKKIDIIMPPSDITAPATAEFRRVLQIMLNLLSNAIRYSPAGSRIRIEHESFDEAVRIAVADDGPGLDEKQQAIIFEKFERLGRSGDGGSGLGLYISRRIARTMGGELHVKSAPGEGARFLLDLPVSDRRS